MCMSLLVVLGCLCLVCAMFDMFVSLGEFSFVCDRSRDSNSDGLCVRCCLFLVL